MKTVWMILGIKKLEIFLNLHYKEGKDLTLPTAEILRGKNVRAFLVCGFLMKSFKKNILKI